MSNTQQTDSRNGKTGLRLAIAKKLVEMMGGQLRIESELGTGSTFSFTIKLYKSEPLEFNDKMREKLADWQILVADDERVILRIVKEWLVELGARHISIAKDGRMALDKLAKQRFDLVFIDDIMPQMDGLETTKQIRKNYTKSDLPIVAMQANFPTSKDGVPDIPDVNAKVNKPFKQEDLAEALLVCLNESQSQPTDLSPPTRMFLSYSYNDRQYLDKLVQGLAPLERKGLISHWHDSKITVGDMLAQDPRRVDNAEVIVILVSPDYLASSYCYKTELTLAYEQAKNNNAVLLPVIVRNCGWLEGPLAEFQALVTDGRALASMQNQEIVWQEVIDGIEKLVEKIRLGKLLPDR